MTMVSSLTAGEINTMPVQELERQASRVVMAIETCVASLRNVEAFNSITPAALWSAVKNSPRGPAGTPAPNSDRQPIVDPKAVIDSVDLLAHLEQKGVAAADVKALCGKGYNIHTHAAANSNSPRRAMVYEIIQPLAQALCDCYAQLDQIPTTHPGVPLNSILQQQRGKSKKRQPPPPPPGMLSLQNYTDIGAFFEFWVCSSILPFVEPHILFAVEDRARYCLPKSLAGRISRPSLLWGCRQQQQQILQKKQKVEHATIALDALRLVVQELQSTVAILGGALLLDRFRPMLLPRHLSDLYAAIFQAEVYTRRIRLLSQQQHKQQPPAEKTDSTDMVKASLPLAREYQDVVALLLPPPTQETNSNSASTNNYHSPAPVDPALQAQSLQTLLLQGTKAPLWLRQRVATRLTDMACQNLSVILQVFVHAAPPKDKTAASLRLARTLVTTSGKSGPNKQAVGEEQGRYYDRLCDQVVQVLDDIVHGCRHTNLTCGNADHLTLKQSLEIHTLWAILEQLPTGEMQSRMLSSLSSGMLGNTNDSVCIHRSVNRIAILLAAIPPSLNPCKLTEVILMPLEDTVVSIMDGTNPTILSQLLRLASLPPSVLKSSFRDDVILTLSIALHLILRSKFNPAKNQTEKGAVVAIDEVEVAAMALLYSVAPSDWDLSGNSYKLDSNSAGEASRQLSGFDCVKIEQQAQGSRQSTKDLVIAVERSVKIIVEDILSPLIQASGSTDDAAQRKEQSLPSVLFHLVLRIYFSSIQSGPQPKVVLPYIFRQSAGASEIDMFRIVSMCILPLLCESCPLDHLLRSSQNDGTGIFRMMQLVFSCAGAYFTSENIFLKPNEAVSPEAKAPENIDGPSSFYQSGTFLSQFLGVSAIEDGKTSTQLESTKQNGEANTNINSLDAEMLLSVVSLLLSLLIAIIELGSKANRSTDEEAVLGSFNSLLRPLAELSDMSWMHSAETTESLSNSSAEVAEMAGHAMALLASRTAPPRNDVDMEATKQMTAKETIEKVLQQGEADLTSAQPPIRARGVVSLQRFLRGHLFQKLLSEDAAPPSRSPLVIDLDEAIEGISPQSAAGYAIDGILHLAISALSDSESYVYLAAVQSIVAAADMCPRKVLPRIALAVASGYTRAQYGKGEGAVGQTKLSSAQQIKLSEALIFCIRRRARLDEFSAMLLDLMLFGGPVGGKESAEDQSDYERVMQIHKETQQYFLAEKAGENSEEGDFEEKAEKQNLRFNTGGPLFGSEETDVVTAGRIAVISELLSAARPSTLARYCHILTSTATDTLRLDASRPVRRAAAFLAREFYHSILREQNELFEMVASSKATEGSSEGTDLALTTALVTSTGDEMLATTLERCLKADDLNDISKEKHRLFDSATAARCQEALEARQEAVDGGVFVVARLVAEARRKHNTLPSTRLVRELLKSERQDVETRIDALRGLRIDPETLELS